VHLANYETIYDLARRTPDVIAEVSNSKGLESALRYLSPEEFEMTIQLSKDTDCAPLLLNSLKSGGARTIRRRVEKWLF
jgi:hypothetical protein